MKYYGFIFENPEFLKAYEEHFFSNFIHLRDIARLYTGKIRIVFFINKEEWGYVVVDGYDSFVKMGKESYFDYVDQAIKGKLSHLRIFKENQKLYEIAQQKEKAFIFDYINGNESLRKINAHRSRNLVLYKNKAMKLVFDLKSKKMNFEPDIPFSNIEHDTNRKFTEDICISLLLDFQNSKDRFIKLLSKPHDMTYAPAYKKYIDILNRKIEFSDEDILTMISILGRLNQEDDMGPITVQKGYKLNPAEVAKHLTTQKYIVECVSTIKEYSNFYLSNRNELSRLGNIGFDGKLNKSNLVQNPIPQLDYCQQVSPQIQIIQPKIVGTVFAPNYIESFFRMITNIPEFENTPILIDDFKDVLLELSNFAKRYKQNTNPDFIILAKIKSILTLKKFGLVVKLLKKKIGGMYSRKTYYRAVAEHILALEYEDVQKAEFVRLIAIFENFIASEIKTFVASKEDNKNSTYNDDEVSIASDMHFNDMKDIAKENFSKNFNILAGDFYNNSYHRSGAKINDVSDIAGIGVLGNHDLNWTESVDEIKHEVETNYRQSVANLQAVFPNVKILNNEVMYRNGVAFVGLTIVADENEYKKRSFFANKELGKYFSKEDYVKQTRKLLDSVDPSVPIVVISHSPFKEYAVCKNEEIGVFSDRIFAGYPNVKVYIHGHGHSKQNSQVIDDVLCITNPIVRNIYRESTFSSDWKTLSGQIANGPVSPLTIPVGQ